MKDNKQVVALFLGTICLTTYVEAIGIQSTSQSESLIQVETESGAQALSENFLNAEAIAEAKMVAQEEEQLEMMEAMNSAEEHKFIEIVTDNESEIINTEVKNEEENAGSDKKEYAIKPNVFDVYDAATGKKMDTSSDFAIVNDNLD